MTGIYKIENLINNKIYIGQAVDINRRIREHFYRAYCETATEYNSYLSRSIRKYGKNNFKVSIIIKCRKEELNKYEKYWILYYKCKIPNGYNFTNGGEGTRGEQSGVAKLTEKEVIQIRIDYDNKVSKKEAYEKVKDKITIHGFSHIWEGKTWKHVLPEVLNKENKAHRKFEQHSRPGEKNPKAKLKTTDVIRIRERKNNGELMREVFKNYDNIISYSTFKKVWNNYTWKEIKV